MASAPLATATVIFFACSIREALAWNARRASSLPFSLIVKTVWTPYCPSCSATALVM